jgi:hypothetical protein
MGCIIAHDGAIGQDQAVDPASPKVELLVDPAALMLSLDHILDDELRQFDHEPPQLGIFLAKGIPFRALVLHTTSARKIATMSVAMTRRRRYMRHADSPTETTHPAPLADQRANTIRRMDRGAALRPPAFMR